MPHTHRLFAGFTLALLAAAPLTLTANTASAAPAGLDACAQQGGVYVVVTQDGTTGTAVTQDGSTPVVIVTQDGPTIGVCVTNPATGTDALKAAGVSIGLDTTGMICTLNNYPNPCPAKYAGKYWHYYQASAADAEAGNWTQASTGADDSHPQAGWVEGWCYGLDSGAQCMPVLPTDDPASPAPSETPTTTATASGPGATIAVVGVIVVILAIGIVILAHRRRR